MIPKPKKIIELKKTIDESVNKSFNTISLSSSSFYSCASTKSKIQNLISKQSQTQIFNLWSGGTQRREQM